MRNTLPWIIMVVVLSVLIMVIMVNNRLSKANKTISSLNNLHSDIDSVLINHFSKLPSEPPLPNIGGINENHFPNLEVKEANKPSKELENGQ